MTRVGLVWLGREPMPDWSLGHVVRAEPTVADLKRVVDRELETSSAEAWLLWAGRLGRPDPDCVRRALGSSSDVWHAGLRLGMGGLPKSIDCVAPTWMLNRDPEASIEATSWRVSLEACLVRSEAMRRLGGIRPGFQTLAGAALELGHRYISRGALIRHLPSLLPIELVERRPELSLEDELRFIYYGFGRTWLRWTVFRSGLSSPMDFARHDALRRALERTTAPPTPPPLREGPFDRNHAKIATGAVTVLIPTVNRYPYLEKLLQQLRHQTVQPLEIIVVDQTPAESRQVDLANRFPDLPLRVFHLDRAGQCSSRNAGLEASRGDYVLFIDDDDEVSPDLIERHLRRLREFGSEVSCGVAEEDGAGPLPPAFRLLRSSDVFPTNNSMVVKEALRRSGLFDLAFDRGARADRDLGMRLYLAGALMVLSPDIVLLHRHAPVGGLRQHGARVVTYAKSRSRLTSRDLPGATEVYLSKRYFSVAQVRESLWLAAMGTFRVRGSVARRVLKAAFAALVLPNTLWRLRRSSKTAEGMLLRFPSIPAYAGMPAGASIVDRPGADRDCPPTVA